MAGGVDAGRSRRRKGKRETERERERERERETSENQIAKHTSPARAPPSQHNTPTHTTPHHTIPHHTTRITFLVQAVHAQGNVGNHLVLLPHHGLLPLHQAPVAHCT